MGIEEELQRRRDQKQQTAETMVRMEAEARRVAPIIQEELEEFRRALVKYQVEPHIVVEMDHEHVPTKKRLFGKITPSYNRFTATPIERCWVFHSLLLFDDGQIAKNPSGGQWGVGKIETWDPDDKNYHLHGAHLREVVRDRAGEALSEAGLGDEVSCDHLYVGPNFEFELVSWESDLRCRTDWDGNVIATIDETSIKFENDVQYLVWRDYETKRDPLSRVFAEYIEEKGRTPGLAALNHRRGTTYF
ncbi:hypothetical protein KIH31_15130 [Paenarthrobacter sp. DKR-5]|uniref:hypothetical protein n=1 Tax=Paenarthrobacter sp. DKR-5 TaxID=2835535 RepID=UPI001BDBF8DE|nr:hypothetical protein [Paenarthrobacter sp. DKR-5]MBT1003927.1 hypothetical protein [Paenarthrobacter sp. DKR-5]